MFERTFIIAPTRSTCLNISLVLQNGEIPSTLLMRERGEQIRAAVSRLRHEGFGIVAGTGTGKTVAIRDILRSIHGQLHVDIVTREHEATERTWQCNVIVVTPGVALNWMKRGVIKSTDLIGIDEIHQTSEHLELAMALAKRQGNRMFWMSATIDPTAYADYLEAGTVIRCEAYDPTKRATVRVVNPDVDDMDPYERRRWNILKEGKQFLDENVAEFARRGRGVVVFVPTRQMAEELAEKYQDFGLTTDFYHGGESVEKLRRFLRGDAPKPFMIFMTSAGASSLNIAGLDTVVMIDQIYRQEVAAGVAVLQQRPLGVNDIIQMGGRVNGRVAGGGIYFITERYEDDFDFHSLKPVQPQFALGGDLQRVALTCARVGVDLHDLDVIGHIDHSLYDREVQRFRQRGIISPDAMALTDYGSAVERLPLDPAWGEILVQAQQLGNPDLLDVAVVAACVPSLYAIVHRQGNVPGSLVYGSDHLTAYNIVAQAINEFGYYTRADGYTFNGGFKRWCREYDINAKQIRETALAMRAVYELMEMDSPLPGNFARVEKDSNLHREFIDLLAQVQSLAYVHDGCAAHARCMVSPDQRSTTRGRRVLGTIRYLGGSYSAKAFVEGTEIPEELVAQYAQKRITRLYGCLYGTHFQGAAALLFAGHELGDQESVMVSSGEVPAAFRPQAQCLFVEWLVDHMCS